MQQCDVSIFSDAMICCTIFAIGLQTTVAMRCVDFFGCDYLLYNICNRITNPMQQCDVSIFQDAMICCTIFAIGLQTHLQQCDVSIFSGCDDMLYNICNRITNNSRNVMCRFFSDAMICCTIFAIGLQTVAMRCVDFFRMR